MKKGFLAGASTGTQLLFAGLVFIASWIVFQLLAIISGFYIFGLSVSDILNVYESFSDPDMVDFLKFVQAITSVGMFIVAAGIAAWSIDNNWKNFLGMKERPELLIFVLSSVFIIVILPFTNFLADFNTNIHLPAFLSSIENYFREQETKMSDIMEVLLKPGGKGGLFVNLLVIAIIPAIGEELTFRGVIQKLLIRLFGNPHRAILVTAFLFSAMHFQFLSFLPRFFLGLVLGYLFFWSRSIWVTMLVHFINNAMAVIFYHYYLGGKIGNYMEKVGTSENNPLYAILGGLAGLSLLYLIYRRYNLQKTIDFNSN